MMRTLLLKGIDNLPAGLGQHVDAFIQRLQARLLPQCLQEEVESDSACRLPAQLLIATSTGLLLFEEASCVRLLGGFFFGLTRHEKRWYAFRKVSGRSGQIISFVLEGRRVYDLRSEVAGLSPGIHQIDAFEDRLYVTDTTNNRLLIYDLKAAKLRCPIRVYPAGRCSGRDDPGYVHMNSVFVTPDRIYLVYHNQSRVTGCPSEIAVLDRQYAVQKRILLDARCAHNVAFWEGKLLYCSSLDGTLVIDDHALPLDAFSRGIALFDDQCIVGGSPFAARVDRDHGDASLFLCDLHTPRVIVQIILKRVGSVYEVRSLRPADQALSEQAGKQLRSRGKALI